jgi:hypothetical protein
LSRRRDFKMAKKNKAYKIKRGQLNDTSGGIPHIFMTVGSLLCIAAAFALAYFWQYGLPDRALTAHISSGGQYSSLAESDSSQKSAASPAPSLQGEEEAASAVFAARGEDSYESAGRELSSLAELSEPPAESHEPLVVGGESSQVSSAQEVGGAQKDFSVPYQVRTSEAVEDAYFDDALFVGDSITTGIEIYGVMSGAAVVASTGINPSTILSKPAIRDREGNLHTVLETMGEYQPKKIYVLLGANGVGWIKQDDFIDYYEQLLEQIERQHPQALIYVQSIFPVTAEKALSENGIYANERIDSYNAALMELCEKRGLPYLNVAEALRGPDGALPAEASTDGIHIIPDYYRKWFDYLKSHTVRPEKE